MKTNCLKATLFLVLLLTSSQLFSQITMPKMFTDNMVLQQKSKSPIWGKTTPNSKVKVKPSWSKKEYLIESDKDGNWKTSIETPSAGGPHKIKISSRDSKHITLNNVMIGEVWICSGQSNMEWPIGGRGQINNFKMEIENANHPNIRLLQVEKNTSNTPLEDIKAAGDGWQVCSPETISEFSATAYFFGRNLQENLNVPIGLIHTSWGGTVAEAWTSTESLSQMPEFIDDVEAFSKVDSKEAKNPNNPTTLYNAMIAPIVPYGIKGAIWYQGESNASRAYQYRTLFPLMISDWRSKWGYDFPFYFVQLANFMDRNEEPSESEWAELREAQLQTLNLDNTGMAVIIDIGEAKDIHPKNKQDVGKRLALQALEETYNQDIVGSGPIYQYYKIENGKIRIFFNNNKSKLKAKGESLKGFSIAGPDKKFYWADAKIDNNEIVVSSPNVKFPIAVRYAWANNPDCNLYNEEDLPASPFRTDDWQGLTINKK